MNGKQAKIMRKIALQTAHSLSDYEVRKGSNRRGPTYNQRRLDKFSLKFIVKTIKKVFDSKSHNQKFNYLRGLLALNLSTT